MPRTQRGLRAMLVAAIVLLLSPALGAEETGPATWYAQALARSDTGLNVTHFWSKGARLRAETVIAGHKLVTLVNGGTYYAYDEITGEGIAIEREQSAVAQDRVDRRPFGNEYERLLALGAEMIGQEEETDRPTGIFRVTDDFGRRKLWVTLDDLHLPLRIEIYERASTRRTTTDYVNWQKGLELADTFFEPDPRAKLERMDYGTYARRTATEGSVGPVPVLYNRLLSSSK